MEVRQNVRGERQSIFHFPMQPSVTVTSSPILAGPITEAFTVPAELTFAHANSCLGLALLQAFRISTGSHDVGHPPVHSQAPHSLQ